MRPETSRGPDFAPGERWVRLEANPLHARHHAPHPRRRAGEHAADRRGPRPAGRISHHARHRAGHRPGGRTRRARATARSGPDRAAEPPPRDFALARRARLQGAALGFPRRAAGHRPHPFLEGGHPRPAGGAERGCAGHHSFHPRPAVSRAAGADGELDFPPGRETGRRRHEPLHLRRRRDDRRVRAGRNRAAGEVHHHLQRHGGRAVSRPGRQPRPRPRRVRHRRRTRS